jgi:hypothetical protein
MTKRRGKNSEWAMVKKKSANEFAHSLYLQSNIIGDEVRWLITSLHHPIVMISNKYNKSAF